MAAEPTGAGGRTGIDQDRLLELEDIGAGLGERTDLLEARLSAVEEFLDGLQAELTIRAAAGQGAPAATRPADLLDLPPLYDRLDDWVTHVLVPIYVREMPSPDWYWCASWWAHPEAEIRLGVLWHQWELLRLAGAEGISSWLALHLDHHLPQLTGPRGPFSRCRSRHVADEPIPLEPRPEPVPGLDPDSKGAMV